MITFSTYEQAREVLDKGRDPRRRPLGYATEACRDCWDGAIRVFHHNTAIITFRPDVETTAKVDGWYSNTTRDRLRAFGVRLGTCAGEWFVPVGELGYQLDRYGHYINREQSGSWYGPSEHEVAQAQDLQAQLAERGLEYPCAGYVSTTKWAARYGLIVPFYDGIQLDANGCAVSAKIPFTARVRLDYFLGAKDLREVPFQRGEVL